MHPGENITSNYARGEKKERASSGPPGSRESPLEKNGRKMKGKSGPPEERRIAHEKKERRNGRKIPAPRGAENPTRRKNFVSGTPISSTCVPSRQHTEQDDARFQPHARTHQKKKGRLRPQKRWRLHPKTKSTATSAEICTCCFFFLPAFVRRKEPIGLAGPRDNERQVTTILSVSPRKPERVLFDART